MSAFPALLVQRISPDGFARKPYFDVEEERSPGGGRLATDWGGSGERWTFTLKTRTEAERDSLEAHFKGQRGRAIPFDFTCPRDGDTQLVAYDVDELDGEPVDASDVYAYRIALRTVP